jgi:prolyl-tRNA synthetase
VRLSTLLGKTLRHPPSEAQLASHQLLVRGAYLRSPEPGQFAFLPLGIRVLNRIQDLVRRELAHVGGQEVDLPSLSESDAQRTLVRLVDREVDSYRQMPVLLLAFRAVSVPEPKVRDGLFGAGERRLADVHAFASEDMSQAPRLVEAALEAVFSACEVAPVWALAGDEGKCAVYIQPAGDEDLAHCSSCDYAALRSWATTAWLQPPDEPELPPEEIHTPDCNTIAALAGFLDIAPARTLKMVFYSVDGEVTCIVIRGDRSVDEAKLARVLGTDWYYISLEDELAAVGAVGGYASPIGLDQSRVRVVADPSVRSGKNFVSGANRPDYHIQNVNVPRDFEPTEWAELARIESGDPCPRCGAPLVVEPAFVLVEGNPPGPCEPEVEYLDPDGRGQALWMAGWHLDLGRLLASVVEDHRDDYGILWPAACAPFDVHLVALDLRREEVEAQVEALYAQLQADGFSVLYDDRDASAGVKFNDADLIGVPLRLTVSKRSVQDGLVEAKWRDSAERLKLDDEGLAKEMARMQPVLRGNGPRRDERHKERARSSQNG